MSTNNTFPINWDAENESAFETKSKEYALASPFGTGSLFMPVQEAFIIDNSGTWYFTWETSGNASDLIEKYRKFDPKLEKSQGNTDDDFDFIVYYETEGRVNLGKVVLIKMNSAMHYSYHNTKDSEKKSILNKWCLGIYEISKARQDFTATVEDLIEAFKKEILYRPLVNNGLHQKTNPELISGGFDKIAEIMRLIKINRESWDPKLMSNEYKLLPFEKALKIILDKLAKFRNHISDFINLVEILKTFSENLILNSVYTLLKAIENNLTLIINAIAGSKKLGTGYFAYLCGIINGIIEMACGIIDIVLLVFKLIMVNEEKSGVEFGLDGLSLREGLEEFIEACLKDPDFLNKQIAEAIKNYNDTRYRDPKLNIYQLAYNAGEDTVIAIDIIISIITVVKGITNSSKYLPKFTKWIDDIIRRNPVVANKIENAILKLTKVALGESELSKLAIRYRRSLPLPTHGGNIAVFEWIDEAKIIRRKEFSTVLGSREHAEVIGMKWLRDNKIPNEAVMRVYSELEPCSLKASNCKQKLQQFKNASIEYTYDYPGDELSGKEIRQASVKLREKELKKHLK